MNLASSSTQPEKLHFYSDMPEGWGLICSGVPLHLENLTVEFNTGHIQLQEKSIYKGKIQEKSLIHEKSLLPEKNYYKREIQIPEKNHYSIFWGFHVFCVCGGSRNLAPL